LYVQIILDSPGCKINGGSSPRILFAEPETPLPATIGSAPEEILILRKKLRLTAPERPPTTFQQLARGLNNLRGKMTRVCAARA
jgi:hypothetical protein